MLGQRQPRLQLPHPRPGSNGVEHGWACLEQMRRPLRSSEGFPSQSPRRVLTRHHSRSWPLAHKPPPRPHPVSSWQCLAEHVLPKPPRTTGRARALRLVEPRHHGETAPERRSPRAAPAKAQMGKTSSPHPWPAQSQGDSEGGPGSAPGPLARRRHWVLSPSASSASGPPEGRTGLPCWSPRQVLTLIHTSEAGCNW